MVISLIVAVTENGVIGNAGNVPWRLPAELDYFRKITIGHAIIMGRKTYESISRSLPGRLNIVLTRKKNYRLSGGVVVHSLEQALALPSLQDETEVFIIGGQEIFERTMPLAQKLYLTTVHTNLPGDRFFVYDPREWELVHSHDHPRDKENQYKFTVQEFTRK
ncbi:MAG TPA: dihydrofolate reductase [Candidatus Babeliales bacterium]|nr:dihydrofolate reductase [Candidatus Babeliales bacterium]